MKGSRDSNRRASRPVKRKAPKNRYHIEQEETSTSASAKKMKMGEYHDVAVDASFGYKILNFVAVFSTISNYVKCKDCDSDVEFVESSIRGLGFKIVIKCASCDPKYIDSCPSTVGHAYEINRRLVFVMRVLGIGAHGIKQFCALMDLPKPVFQTTYDSIVRNIHCAAEAVCNMSLTKAAKEEKQSTADFEKVQEPAGLIVSGNGTWRKIDFPSLHGVASLIGYFSGKVLDTLIKFAFCKGCESMRRKIGTAEHEEWSETHECAVNREENAGNMEVDGIREMFHRSEQLHGLKYLNYIGGANCETSKGLIESDPYDVPIKQKQCISNLQKAMGTRLRSLKTKTAGLDGQGKLTGKLIDELTAHYGIAIRSNCDSIKEMKKAIWATFFHKVSTNDKPQHQNCPPGTDSWCSWQKAHAESKLNEYTHEAALHSDVEKSILPVYDEFSSDNLLEQCLGGFDQNNSENVNALIWEIASKINSNDYKIIEIAAWIATAIFNDGQKSLLDILQVMNVKIGPRAYEMCMEEDASRVTVADVRAQQAVKDLRTARRLSGLACEEAGSSTAD